MFIPQNLQRKHAWAARSPRGPSRRAGPFPTHFIVVNWSGPNSPLDEEMLLSTVRSRLRTSVCDWAFVTALVACNCALIW
jgi:hypothetical protein